MIPSMPDTCRAQTTTEKPCTRKLHTENAGVDLCGLHELQRRRAEQYPNNKRYVRSWRGYRGAE